MATFTSGNIATFTLAGTDISSYVTSVSPDLARDIKDVKPIGGSAISKVVGAYGGTISVECGYDPVLDAIVAALFLAATPASSTFSHRPTGSGGGTRAIAGNALVATYRVDTSGDDVAKLRFNLAIVGTVTNS